MIIAAAIFTAALYAAAVWVYLLVPGKADLRGDGREMWFLFGWIVPFTAATVPTALMWTHL